METPVDQAPTIDDPMKETATRKSERKKEIVISSDDESEYVDPIKSTKRGRKIKKVNYAEVDENDSSRRRSEKIVTDTGDINEHIEHNGSANKGNNHSLGNKGNNLKKGSQANKDSKSPGIYSSIKDILEKDLQDGNTDNTETSKIKTAAKKTSKVIENSSEDSSYTDPTLRKNNKKNSLIKNVHNMVDSYNSTSSLPEATPSKIPNDGTSNTSVNNDIVKEMQRQIYQQYLQFSQLIENVDPRDVRQIVGGTQKIIDQFKELSKILKKEKEDKSPVKGSSGGKNTKTTLKRKKTNGEDPGVNDYMDNPTNGNPDITDIMPPKVQKLSATGVSTNAKKSEKARKTVINKSGETIPDINDILPIELQSRGRKGKTTKKQNNVTKKKAPDSSSADKEMPATGTSEEPMFDVDEEEAPHSQIDTDTSQSASPIKDIIRKISGYEKSKKSVVGKKGKIGNKKTPDGVKPSTGIPHISEVIPFQLLGNVDGKGSSERNKENNNPTTPEKTPDQTETDSMPTNVKKLVSPKASNSRKTIAGNKKKKNPKQNTKNLGTEKDQRKSKRQTKKRVQPVEVNYDSDSSIEIFDVDSHADDDEASAEEPKKNITTEDDGTKKRTARKSTGGKSKTTARKSIPSEASPCKSVTSETSP